ncbi:Hypothetical_protein [Hexamita inflata]|uniref:Hypothetical_protein n=1 Tax=Hexamita inflata TaxID=28002 RepID=A0ABP1HMH2_9EUKA
MTHLTVTLSSVLRLNLIIPSQSRKSLESTNPNLDTQQRYLKLISTSYLIFQDCHSEQPPQTSQVSSALELTLLTLEVIFVTIFGMAGMNLGTSVSAATRGASMFKSGNKVINLQSVSSCSGSFTLCNILTAKICVCVLLLQIINAFLLTYYYKYYKSLIVIISNTLKWKYIIQ